MRSLVKAAQKGALHRGSASAITKFGKESGFRSRATPARIAGEFPRSARASLVAERAPQGGARSLQSMIAW
jgi:hypothetical protein